MEATKQETTILSKLDEDDCKTWIDPAKLRISFDWLTIEKEMKGQRWFIKDFLDKGAVLNRDDDGKRFYAFESMITVTLDEDERGFPHYLSSENPPYYVRVLKYEIPDSVGIDVPPVIIKLWEELNG